MVLLSCYQLAESFATTQTSQTSPSTSQINDDTSNARVFVAGISHTCTEQAIRSTLSKFGTINEVTIDVKNSCVEFLWRGLLSDYYRGGAAH